jgi:alpha-tubulin suppressor-like RCC1 family protein
MTFTADHAGPKPPDGDHQEVKKRVDENGKVEYTVVYKTFDLNAQRFKGGVKEFGGALSEEEYVISFLTPGPVEWAGPKLKREVLHFACGMLHFIVVAKDPGRDDARVYSSGANQYGQLGHGDQFERHELTPIRSLDDERICMAACGNHHTLALALDGRVFAWGRADKGQLGLYETMQVPGALQSHPMEVAFPEETMKDSCIVDISCGGDFSFARTGVGALYSWGYNDLGATGHPSDSANDIHLPKLVELESSLDVQAASGGGQHSLFLVKQYQEA